MVAFLSKNKQVCSCDNEYAVNRGPRVWVYHKRPANNLPCAHIVHVCLPVCACLSKGTEVEVALSDDTHC